MFQKPRLVDRNSLRRGFDKILNQLNCEIASLSKKLKKQNATQKEITTQLDSLMHLRDHVVEWQSEIDYIVSQWFMSYGKAADFATTLYAHLDHLITIQIEAIQECLKCKDLALQESLFKERNLLIEKLRTEISSIEDEFLESYRKQQLQVLEEACSLGQADSEGARAHIAYRFFEKNSFCPVKLFLKTKQIESRTLMKVISAFKFVNKRCRDAKEQ